MSKENGGPAFPIPGAVFHYDEGDVRDKHYAGMTLRDYFAAHALHGLLGSSRKVRFELAGDNDPDGLAKCAYELADSLLAWRDK